MSRTYSLQLIERLIIRIFLISPISDFPIMGPNRSNDMNDQDDEPT